MGITLGLLGLEDITIKGSLIYGLGFSAIGILFTTLVAFLAQLYQSNRVVMSTSFFLLLGFYILFSIGAVSSDVIMWLSPFKWMVHAQPYVNNLIWPLLLILLVSSGFAVSALYLSSIRDLDSGLFQTKKGQQKIAKYASNPLGFYIRIGKSQFLIWIIGMFILGASYGSIFGDLEAYLANNTFFEDILPELPGVPLAVQFMGFIMVVLGMVSIIPAIMAMNKLASEERKNRSEIIMSHDVSRLKMILSHFTIALITGISALFMSALGMYAASMPAMDDPILFTTFLSAIMVYVPTLIMMLGISVLITGFTPNKTWIIWAFLGYSFFVSYIGQLLDLSDFLVKITPFGYIPKLPVDDMNWLAQFIILIIGLLLGYIGYRNYQKRDLQG
jgi:ABC-2 type transport system permease protein